ncbi:MAG: ABC transporter permease subunit [Frankiaceae bacterium]
MIRLVRVELQRLAARRLVKLLLVLLLVALVSTAAVQGWQSNRDVAGARAKAEQAAAGISIPPDAIAQCETEAKAQHVPPEALRCRPVAADFYHDPRLVYATNAPLFANGGVGLGLAFTGIVAIGVIGAEWAAGTFAALLLWEPRRRRVLVAKLAAVSLTGAAVTAAMAAAFTAVAAAIAATRGSMAGRIGAATHIAVLHGARGVLVAALLAIVVGSLAVVVRSTAGALGVVAIYAIVVENVVRAWRPHWTRWQLGPNLIALISGRLDLEPVGSAPGSGPQQLFRLSGGRAGMYLVALAIVAAGCAAVFLQRRDVT